MGSSPGHRDHICTVLHFTRLALNSKLYAYNPILLSSNEDIFHATILEVGDIVGKQTLGLLGWCCT